MAFNGELHAEIGSTQARLRELLLNDPHLPHGYSVMAEIQTAGKGRSDHSWVSVKGNLHVSILLREAPVSPITWTPLWASVCLLHALKALGVDDSKIQLKWPNDLWINRSKKIAGILCEKKGDTFIVGIGLNLVKAPEVAQVAGSISEISEAVISTTTILEALQLQFSLVKDLTEVKKAYEQHALFNLGDTVEWHDGFDQIKKSGNVQKIGEYGELLVESAGKTVSLFVDDVRTMRRKLKV